jgi:hypothetical protein
MKPMSNEQCQQITGGFQYSRPVRFAPIFPTQDLVETIQRVLNARNAFYGRTIFAQDRPSYTFAGN